LSKPDLNTNIQQVARRAGVSAATVSYVLNETRKVRPETRRRVLAAIHALGYSPNMSARNLAIGRSHILGLIISDIRNPFFPEITTSFQEAANVCDMEVIVMNTNYNPLLTNSSVERLLRWQVAGMAILTSEIEPSMMHLLESQNVCSVYLDLGHVNRHMSNIAVDYEHGVVAALRHLEALGHRRIGFVGGLPSLVSAQERKKAFVACAEKISHVQTKIIDSDFTVQGGYVACSRLLAGFPATAILAANDLMAIGAMHYAFDRGIEIPAHLSVVGFDDIAFAQSTFPPLTSVAIPRAEIGNIAFSALWSMISDSGTGREYQVRTNLVIRDSTAQVP